MILRSRLWNVVRSADATWVRTMWTNCDAILVGNLGRSFSGQITYFSSAPAGRSSPYTLTLLSRRFSTGLHRSASSSKSSIDDDDHYRMLGVPRTASPEEVKAAFFQLSKLYHPDVNKSEHALNDFLKIRSAYEVLADASKKKEYDKTISKNGKENVVDDMYPPGWKSQERERRKQKRKEEEEWVEFEEIERTSRRGFYKEAEDEYMKYYGKYAPDMDPTRHEVLVMWLKFKVWLRKIYRLHPKFWPLLFVLLLVKMYVVYGPHFDQRTITVDLDQSDNESEYDKWLSAEHSRRLQWQENEDRLSEMLEEQRKKEHEEILKSYKTLNPD